MKPLAVVLRGVRLALGAVVALVLLVPVFAALFAAMGWDAVAGRIRRLLSRSQPTAWPPIAVPPASSNGREPG